MIFAILASAGAPADAWEPWAVGMAGGFGSLGPRMSVTSEGLVSRIPELRVLPWHPGCGG